MSDMVEGGIAGDAPDSPVKASLRDRLHGNETTEFFPRLRLFTMLFCALFTGCAAFLVSAGCASLPTLFLSETGWFLPVTSAAGFLVGGMVSGAIIEPVIRHRRWRFFYLAGSTPGALVWAVIVVCLLLGVGFESGHLWWIVGAWVFSVAGSLAGSFLAYKHDASGSTRDGNRRESGTMLERRNGGA